MDVSNENIKNLFELSEFFDAIYEKYFSTDKIYYFPLIERFLNRKFKQLDIQQDFPYIVYFLTTWGNAKITGYVLGSSYASKVEELKSGDPFHTWIKPMTYMVVLRKSTRSYF